MNFDRKNLMQTYQNSIYHNKSHNKTQNKQIKPNLIKYLINMATPCHTAHTTQKELNFLAQSHE